MKITLWGINYPPEVTGIAPFNAGLAEYLAAHGHDVEVVTAFAYYPQWRKAPGDARRLFRTDEHQGVRVHRCWHYVPWVPTTLRRIAHELSFGVTSFLRVLALRRADVYVVVSPPLILGFFAWVATRLKWSRFVFHVQDLQPDAAVGLNMLRGRMFIRALYALERFTYRRAAAVSGISDGMLLAFARKGLPARRRIYFPNWLHQPALEPAAAGNFRARFGLPADAMLAVYSGNLGRKQGIEILLDAAEWLRSSADEAARRVMIVIAGSGAGRAALEQSVAERGLPNLKLLPLLADEDYAAMLRETDVGLITQAPGTGQFFFPSKLLSLLRAGLPVVSVADEESELARALADGGFGANVPSGRAQQLAEILRQASAEPLLLRAWASRTRWVQQFSPALVLPLFAQHLEHLVEDTRQQVGVPLNRREPSHL